MSDLGTTIQYAVLVAIIVGVVLVGGLSRARGRDEAGTVAASKVMSAHQQDLLYLREEEKLARDVYLSLYKLWGTPIFANISQSEERHMNQMAALLRRNGLSDPIVDKSVGAFANKKLEALYKTLVARGSTSEVEALRVGADIEERDIHDIVGMKNRTTDASALITFARLECGSRNHLRAFLRLLRARGADFTPGHLARRQVKAIVDGPVERCGRQGRRGWRGRRWYRATPPHAH